MKHIVALSGGKDSTAMALRLQEVEPREYIWVCTPTGEEPPEWYAHMLRLEELLGGKIVRLPSETLESLKTKWKAIPNFRQRWCTRVIKLEPFYEFVDNNLPAVSYVGLRVDEEQREGFTGGDFQIDFPLQRWGWGLDDVLGYLNFRGVEINFRTDCMCCFYQRLYEWYKCWRDYPNLFWKYANWEDEVGHTFRSPQRDSWPAGLRLLAAEFEKGRVPRQTQRTVKSKGCAWCQM